MSISRLNPYRLTKLYSDAKVSANNVVDAEQPPSTTTKVDSPEYQELQRKFRIQKDRLVTWGMQWSDETRGKEGIDEKVAQAGLTETVKNMMSRINEILEEVERMRTGTMIATGGSDSPLKIGAFPVPPTEASCDLTADDMERCEALCNELSSCIEVLYELSRSRRAIQQGTYPIIAADAGQQQGPLDKQTLPPPTTKPLFTNRSFSSSGETLVNPSRVATEKTVVTYDLPPRMDKKDLILQQEPPPSYGSHGNQPVRMVGHMKYSGAANTKPVIVEYAFFDPTYRETGVHLPPTEKLDALLEYFARNNATATSASTGILDCAGWFEDTDYSRFGIVYELPQIVQAPGANGRSRDLRPSSLVEILQPASKSSTASTVQRSSAGAVPALEDRFRLAYNILRSVAQLQEESNVMHRNICSNNILFFARDATADASVAEQYELATPFLAGFDIFTEYNVATEDLPHEQQDLNIYRHPDAFKRSKPYRPEYDSYSLALVLMEIALWIPLSDLWKSKYTLSEFRSRLEVIWLKRLAAKVGSTYMNVVKDLMTIGNTRRSGSAPLPDARSRLSQMYSRSLHRLKRCCMIDETETFDSPMESMQSSTLENMVQQGALIERQQEVNRWTEKMRLFEEPSSAGPAPTFNLGMIAQPLVSRFDGAERPGPDATTEHQYPHTLPVAIEEANEESLSRQASTASRRRSGLPSRWSFGLGASTKTPEHETTPSQSTPTMYHSAAETIQRAWRNRRDPPSLKEYKRKVTVIQHLWRRRQTTRSNTASTGSDTGVSSFYASAESIGRQQDSNQNAPKRTVNRTDQPIPAPRKKLRIQPKQLPPAQVTEWHTLLLPRLERIVDRALRDSPETCSIDLLCVGDTIEKARPTIFVTCSSTARVKAALSRKFQFDRDAYELKVRRGSIRRSHTRRRVREAHRSMAIPIASSRNDPSAVPLNPFHQRRPICGASIGAYAKAQHLPPVSFGGVVAIDDGEGTELYGMTVHHLLDSPSDEEEEDEDDDADRESGFYEDDSDEASLAQATRSSAAGGSWLAGMGAAPGLDLSESDIHSGFLDISDDSSIASDADAPELEYSSDEEEEEGSIVNSHASTEGDLVGVLPGDEFDSPVYVTQPAIDDVAEDFFPDIDDRDEDHLSSHKLGVVYASSGIRRWQRDGTAHEVDWALIRLEKDRLQPINVVQGGRRYLRPHKGSPLLRNGSTHKPDDSGIDTNSPNPFLEASNAHREKLRPKLEEPVSRSPYFRAEDDEYPTAIVPADQLASLRVHSFGRTSGLQQGIIGDCMSSVRIYRRRSFSRSWHVLGGFGMGGDSGAWILENDTGRVCGHVLAFAERNSMAYICPLEIMFEDMLRVLDAKSIWLPGGEDAAVGLRLSRKGTFQSRTSGASAEDDDEQLPFELNELSIDDDSDERPGGVVLRSSPLRQTTRNSHVGKDHDRERLMYAPGGVLSMPRGEGMVGADREPQRLVV